MADKLTKTIKKLGDFYTRSPGAEPPKNWTQELIKNVAALQSTMTDQSNRAGMQQSANTTRLNDALQASIRKGTKQATRDTWQLEKKYSPKYADLYNSIIDKSNPGFRDVYKNLGDRVNSDLARGYSLNPEMAREIEQDVRGAQDARGNWVGPAPTADEAFSKASARQSLYQNRLQNAQGFLSARAPTDMYGAIRGGTAATQRYNPATSASFYDPQVATTATGMQAQADQNYFNNRLNSYQADQAAQQQRYQNMWGQYAYQNGMATAGGGGSASVGGGGYGGAIGMGAGAILGGVVGSIIPGAGTLAGATLGAAIGGGIGEAAGG